MVAHTSAGAHTVVHAPKHETFDLVAKTNVDPKGFVRVVDEYRVEPWGLYMARPSDHAHFDYLESWLLPALGLRASVFHYLPAHARDQDYYVDIGEYTAGASRWTSVDHYLDLSVRTGRDYDLLDVDELFDAFRTNFDRLDIIVSNAASGVLKPTVEMTLKHWRWCLETNALALNLLAQRALPLMADGGRIIALSSLGASRAMPGYGFVGASKAALEALARALAQELGPRGIRVNTVSAGVVDTDALEYFPNREELLANYAARTPAGPVLTPEDVAGAVYLLCLPEAAMINGHTLVVDGGFAISG